ncbi:MAG: carbohydrate ABC transporter permease, partial [Devosia nanyangense]|nr:carbohydrate ABC transporter permease [Devosia nanyangense]
MAMVILCVPGVWVVLTAFRPNIEILARPAVWIPHELTLNNFKGIFGLLPT